MRKLHHHDRYVGSCAFSWTGSFFATGSNDKSVAIFDWLDHDANMMIPTLARFDENDHRLSVLAGREDTLMVGSVKAHNSDINSMIFINDRDLISCSSDKTVKLWTSVDQGSDQVKVRTINQRSYAIYACDFSKSRNLLVVAAMDGQTLVWDTDKWIKLATLVAPGHAAIRTCSISQDSAYVIVGGDDDMAHIFDLYDFSYIRGLKGHEATVFYATFTHESSHVLTGDNDGVINCWNVLYTVKEKKMKPSFSVDVAHDLGISCGDCKPMTGDPGDYSIIVTGGNDSLLKVWKIRIAGAKCSTIEAVQTLTGHGCSVMSIKFAPHAKFFVSTSGDKTSRLWDANNFVCLRVLEGHDRYVNCAAFNHDGSLLATGSNDRSFNVWRLSGTLDKSNMARPSSGAVSTLKHYYFFKAYIFNVFNFLLGYGRMESG
jgi:WD40 repeat protein